MKIDYFSKIIIVITTILLISIFVVYYSSCSNDDEGDYACYGDNGTSDHCWEANSSNESDCLTQGRTFSSGSCADNGYSKDCGTYWVYSWVACW